MLGDGPSRSRGNEGGNNGELHFGDKLMITTTFSYEDLCDTWLMPACLVQACACWKSAASFLMLVRRCRWHLLARHVRKKIFDIT